MAQELAKPQGTMRQMLDEQIPDFEKLLGNPRIARRYIQIAMDECLRTPKLMDCTKESILKCLMETAGLRLEYGRMRRQMYMIPFKGVAENVMGYGGLIELCLRSGSVARIDACGVYENDKFSEVLGTNPSIEHIPAPGDRGNLIGAYAWALTNGERKHVYMRRAEIESIRNRSRGWQAYESKLISTTPWVTDEEEMFKKTALRRLTKYLPSAVISDDAADYLDQEDKREFIDVEAREVHVEPVLGKEGRRKVQTKSVTRDEPPAPEKLPDDEQPAAAPAPTKVYLSNSDRRLLWGKARDYGWDEPGARDFLATLGYGSTTEIESKDLPDILRAMSEGPPKAAPVAQAEPATPITADQMGQINEALLEADITRTVFREYLGSIHIGSVAEITSNRFDEIMGWIKKSATA